MIGASAWPLQLGVSPVLQELLGVEGRIQGSVVPFVQFYARAQIWLAREALFPLRTERLCFSPGHATYWLCGLGISLHVSVPRFP